MGLTSTSTHQFPDFPRHSLISGPLHGWSSIFKGVFIAKDMMMQRGLRMATCEKNHQNSFHAFHERPYSHIGFFRCSLKESYVVMGLRLCLLFQRITLLQEFLWMSCHTGRKAQPHDAFPESGRHLSILLWSPPATNSAARG